MIIPMFKTKQKTIKYLRDNGKIVGNTLYLDEGIKTSISNKSKKAISNNIKTLEEYENKYNG